MLNEEVFYKDSLNLKEQKTVRYKSQLINLLVHIKVSWCKDFCVLNKRICHKKLNDLQFDMYERLLTY